jgi:flagellin-specific chaperone FliS
MDVEQYRMLLSKMPELVENLMDHLNEKDDDEGIELARELIDQYDLTLRVLTDAIISLGEPL